MTEYKTYTVIGLREVSKPTPAWAKKLLAVILVVLGLVATHVHNAPGIPVEVKEQVMYWAGSLAGSLSALAPFMGIRTRAVRHD